MDVLQHKNEKAEIDVRRILASVSLNVEIREIFSHNSCFKSNLLSLRRPSLKTTPDFFKSSNERPLNLTAKTINA